MLHNFLWIDEVFVCFWSQVIPCAQRDALYCLHENGCITLRVCRSTTTPEEGAGMLYRFRRTHTYTHLLKGGGSCRHLSCPHLMYLCLCFIGQHESIVSLNLSHLFSVLSSIIFFPIYIFRVFCPLIYSLPPILCLLLYIFCHSNLFSSIFHLHFCRFLSLPHPLFLFCFIYY